MERLDELSLIVSECEKLRCTPLPLSYSRHTSRCDPPPRSAGPLFYACGGARGRDAAHNGARRFFSLFTLSLPFALVKETSPLLVPTVVTATAWVLFATDEIGKIIEDPFGCRAACSASPCLRACSRIALLACLLPHRAVCMLALCVSPVLH
jgi:hypothetical protein